MQPTLSIHRPYRDLQLLTVTQSEVHLLSAGWPLHHLKQIVVFLPELQVRGVTFLTETLTRLRPVAQVSALNEQTVVLHLEHVLAIAFVHVLSVALNVVGGGLQGLLGLFEGYAFGARLLLAHRAFILCEAVCEGLVQAVFRVFGSGEEAVEVGGCRLEESLLCAAAEAPLSVFETGEDRLGMGCCPD